MSPPDRPAPPRRLPREREPSRRGAPPPPDAPVEPSPEPPPRGPARRHDRFLLIPIAVLAILAVIVVVFKARGKRERTGPEHRWNAPARTDRHARLADVLAQAETRAGKLIPGAKVARIAVRHLAPDGMVDMNYGSVDVVLVAPDGAGAAAGDGVPCAVELSASWHGWRQKTEDTCDARPVTLRCPASEVIARAFEPPLPDDVVAELAPLPAGERPGAPADLGVWTVRTAPGEPPRRVIDDCAAAPAAAPAGVQVHGALREIMHGGATDGRVALADVVTPRTIAVGALDGLRGEVTVLDGAVRTSVVDGEAIASAEGAGDRRAALLVIAEVPAWRSVTIDREVGADELDARIGELLRAAGATGPTPIVIEGSFDVLDWHVVDGPHAHGEPAGAQRATPGRAVLAGFYSTDHEGVFTHMGQATHLHALVGADTGHVERVAIAPGAVLKLPAD